MFCTSSVPIITSVAQKSFSIIGTEEATHDITETPLLLKIIHLAMSVPRYLQPLAIFDTSYFLVILKVSEGTLFMLLSSSSCGQDSRGKVVMLLKSVDSHD